MKIIRTYSELVTLNTFKERFQYLQLNGVVGRETFGTYRYLNQAFYQSPKWKKIRDEVIIRDNGCDLGIDGFEIYDGIYIHHMNPITEEDILEESDYLLNPEFLISTRFTTHNAIHYGDNNLLITQSIERTPNDTCPWRH